MKELKKWLNIAIDKAIIGEGELDYWFRTSKHICFQPPGLKLTYRISVCDDNRDVVQRLEGFRKRVKAVKWYVIHRNNAGVKL